MVGFRSSLSLLTTLALSGSALGQLEDTGLDRNNATVPLTGSRFIVEFSDEGSSKFRKRDGSPDTEDFYERIKETNVTAVPAQNFTSELFHGASFDVVNGTALTVEEIEALPEVKKVWPVNMVYAPTPDSTGEEAEVTKWNPHVLTRVDRAHAAGFDGSDVIIAVVDSGIDYNHPALGGGFGSGFKVESGYDLVGDEYDPNNWSVTYPDEDPMDCLGHGTHVAGIIASGNKDLPGVAPNARLRAYKVFGCQDGVTEDIIAAAILRAFEDGADIITASLGSDVGFPDNMVAAVISRITAQGTFVSAAAGNSGIRGPFLSSNLANAHGSLTVGSIEHHQKPVYKVVAKSSSGELRDIYYVSDDLLPWKRDGSYKAYLPDVPRDWDVCRAFSVPQPAGGLPQDDILVVSRGRWGVCPDTWQVMDSIMFYEGIKWVFFYNYPNISYQTPERAVYMDNQAIGFASIHYEDGIWLEEQDEAGNSIEFVFEHQPGQALAIEDGASRMSEFSNWGSTLDGRMKPEISAPGGRILSTYLTNDGSWAVFSGTSMATPYIAGVAALFFNSVGGRNRLCSNPADAAVRRIIASGQATQHWSSSVKAPVAHAGAGLVDAYKVVAFDTSISPANINLNDTMFFSPKHTITVKNRGNSTVTYRIGHEAGSTTRSRGYGDAWISFDPVIRTDQGLATVKFSTEELEVPAGGRATFDVEFAEPTDVDPGVMAMYGGEIHIVGDNGEAVKTTYMGIKGAIYDADVWEIHRGVPVFFGQNGYGDAFQDGREFTLPDMPALYFNVLWSTRELSFELVQPDWETSDWQYPPVPGQNKVIGSTVYRDDWTGNWIPFPITDLLRAAGVFWLSISSELVGGIKIEPGEYRLLARALRTYGDREKAEDWQFRLSPVFKINASE